LKQEFELAHWQSRLKSAFQPRIPVQPYVPSARQTPLRTLDVNSAWAGIERILADLIGQFDIPTERCLEFGVEFGFSAVALSSYFQSVTGVDTFQGDIHTVNNQDIYDDTRARLAPYPNIQLVRSDYRDFIKQDHGDFGLVHVDIVHTFADTYACGLWSARHSRCTIFHDTESFPQVKQAVREIARATGKKVYNFEESYGLGIVV
jgi:hypothetical protein